MAGDLQLQEQLIVESGARSRARAVGEPTQEGRLLHVYGDRVRIVEEVMAAAKSGAAANSPGGLTEIEKLGVGAFQLRNSSAYRKAKANRPKAGAAWNLPPGGCTAIAPLATQAARSAQAAAPPTSAFMEGSIAVGLVIVEGPGAALRFSSEERTHTVAEVQNGLSFFAQQQPAAGLTFVHDIQIVTLNVEPDPNATDLEALWRDPAMAAMGYPSGFAGARQYIEHLRQTFKTRWTYCAFFTKYPVFHFAYAFLGGPYLVMQYSNDGWGPENIDRVFAHETGHIFNAPDEYASSGCTLGGTYGRWSKPNDNCANGLPDGGCACIMKGNDWQTCTYSPAHLGWMPARLFAKSDNLALDVSGASTANGAALIQYPLHGGENQQFRLDPLGSGMYRIVAQHTGKVLDVSGAATGPGVPIIQYDWHGGDNQRFQIEPLDDGSVRIIASHSGKVLDVSGNSSASGTPIIQWHWHGGANQRWLLGAPLTAKHSGLALDVSDGSHNAGAKLIQYHYHGYGNQVFIAIPLGDGFVRIVAAHSGLVLDISGGSTANGAEVIQWPWHGGDNQRFRIVQLADGHACIVAKHSRKVLDVSGNSNADGTPIIQWDWHGGANQRWLVPQLRLVPNLLSRAEEVGVGHVMPDEGPSRPKQEEAIASTFARSR